MTCDITAALHRGRARALTIALPALLLLAACQSNEDVGLRTGQDAPAAQTGTATEDGIGLRSGPETRATAPQPIIQPGENTTIGVIGWINRDNRSLIVNLNANYANLGSFLAARDEQGRYTAILKPGITRADQTASAEILEGYPANGQQVIVPNAQTLRDIATSHTE